MPQRDDQSGPPSTGRGVATAGSAGPSWALSAAPALPAHFPGRAAPSPDVGGACGPRLTRGESGVGGGEGTTGGAWSCGVLGRDAQAASARCAGRGHREGQTHGLCKGPVAAPGTSPPGARAHGPGLQGQGLCRLLSLLACVSPSGWSELLRGARPPQGPAGRASPSWAVGARLSLGPGPTASWERPGWPSSALPAAAEPRAPGQPRAGPDSAALGGRCTRTGCRELGAPTPPIPGRA